MPAIGARIDAAAKMTEKDFKWQVFMRVTP
jgi:hypothetical protein